MNARRNVAKERIFVLDTNVLLHDPRALFNFPKAVVGVPAVVIEELDKFKGEPSGRGRNTREAIRSLDHLRLQGSLATGVELDNGSIVRVLFLSDADSCPSPFKLNIEDNEILLTALCLKHQGHTVTFISKDLNARVKADVLGIEAEDYVREHISEDQFYKGWVEIQVPSIQLKKDIPNELEDAIKEHELIVNQFVLVSSKNNPHNNRIFRYLGGKNFRAVDEPGFRWPLKARNPQQLMALDLLLDDAVQLVILSGPAGTGKTFLALLAGLHKVLIEDHYRKILISRPVVPLGRDLGYLPGDVQEKLHSWMLPIYDNMEFIMHYAHVAKHLDFAQKDFQKEGEDELWPSRKRHEKREQRERRNRHERSGGGKLQSLDELLKHEKISLEAITYMRGRSIPYQYILIDEVQNLTPHEVKTLVSRVGEGSKIILAGDPYQIDSPYLDFSSNGLMVTSELLKGQNIVGSVFLESSVRSELSDMAGKLL